MNLGEKIKKLRESNNLSKDEMSRISGISTDKIDNFENESKKPNIEEIKKLSQIFGVSIDDLLDNNTKFVIYKKDSNVEKVAGAMLPVISTFKTIFILIIILGLMALVFFAIVYSTS